MSLAEPSATRTNGWLRAAVLAALLLAAALRWWEPALVEFKYDEAHITGLGLDLARGGAPLLLSGGTTFGIQRGALDVYLLALPLKLAGGRVEAAVWFTSALGVLSVALTYLLGRKAGGPLVGLLAALFMAANPWLVFYDRKLWAHIQVVFSAILFLLAWQVVVIRRGRGRVLVPGDRRTADASARAGSRPGAELVGRVRRRPASLAAPRDSAGPGRRSRPAASLCVGSVAAWGPGPDGRRRAGQRNARCRGDRCAAAGPARRGPAFQRRRAAHPRRAAAAAVTPWRLTGELLIPLSVLLGLGVLRTAWRCRAGPAAPGARLLLAWTIGPVLLLTFAPLRPPLQYWTVLLPLPALYLAIGLEWVAVGVAKAVSRLAPSGRKTQPASTPALAWALSLAVVVALIVIWTASYRDLLLAVDAGAGATTFGPPLKRWEEATGAARRLGPTTWDRRGARCGGRRRSGLSG